MSDEGHNFKKTKKFVSICSDSLSSPFSKVTYRFGKIGDVELEKVASGAKQFKTTTQLIGKNGRKNSFSFSIGKYTYQISDVKGREGTIEEGVYLDVTRMGKNVVSFYSGAHEGKDFESGLIDIDFTQANVPMHLSKENQSPRESAAFSWGGVLRAGPSTSSRKIKSVTNKEPIIILEEASEKLNNYPWFKIRVGDTEGYHWGGIICDETRVPKTFCE